MKSARCTWWSCSRESKKNRSYRLLRRRPSTNYCLRIWVQSFRLPKRCWRLTALSRKPASINPLWFSSFPWLCGFRLTGLAQLEKRMINNHRGKCNPSFHLPGSSPRNVADETSLHALHQRGGAFRSGRSKVSKKHFGKDKHWQQSFQRTGYFL